jgi:predicted transcriptional regulator
MDKILSARIDEAVIRQIALLARELNTTKKAVIESAVKLKKSSPAVSRA